MGQIFVHRETVMWQCRLSPTVFESVPERWRDGAGSSPTLGINHRDACTHHCVGPTPPIFDCRETVMGAAPAGAHSMRECRGAMVRQRRLNAYLGFPVTPRLARMLAREVVGTDYRLSRNGDGADPVAAHSMRACRGAMVRQRRLNAYLGYPVSPMLACMFAREVDGTDFRPSRSGDETEPVAAHSMRACRGAMVRQRRLYAYLGYPVTPRLARMFALVGRRDRFSTVEKRWWDCARFGAQYASVSGSDGATRQAVCLPRVSGRTEACTHVGAGS